MIAFLDQDDLWLPRKLTLQVRALEADPSIDIAFGQHRLIVEDESTLVSPGFAWKDSDSRAAW